MVVDCKRLSAGIERRRGYVSFFVRGRRWIPFREWLWLVLLLHSGSPAKTSWRHSSAKRNLPEARPEPRLTFAGRGVWRSWKRRSVSALSLPKTEVSADKSFGSSADNLLHKFSAEPFFQKGSWWGSPRGRKAPSPHPREPRREPRNPLLPDLLSPKPLPIPISEARWHRR